MLINKYSKQHPWYWMRFRSEYSLVWTEMFVLENQLAIYNDYLFYKELLAMF